MLLFLGEVNTMNKYIVKLRKARQACVERNLNLFLDYLSTLSKKEHTVIRLHELHDSANLAALNELLPYRYFKDLTPTSTIKEFKYILVKKGFYIIEEEEATRGIVKEKRFMFFNLFSKQVVVPCKNLIHFIIIS